ncbi:MAG: phosphate signaling complex protein PhoU [Planctomycetia bacterium]|nr:phosphate signaling complex protein PhoU [Planctomycetia bacterium]
MSVHLEREIDKIKKRVLSLSAIVEDQLQMSVRAMLDRDEELARTIRERDAEIDQLEIEVEEECLKTLALYQPVAIDLRLIVAVLKINNDLERIGDLAVNIARKARRLAVLPAIENPFDLSGMAEKTQAMLRDSIDALVNMDVALAGDVCGRDDEIDAMKREIRRTSEAMIGREPEHVAAILNLMAASRNLERVADLATNIAEDVIYMVEGKIVRHGEGE